MIEKWLPMIGHRGYEVSDLGNIFSAKSKRNLKPGKNSRGYMTISIYGGSKKSKKNYLVHRLVAGSFIGPSELYVDHMDGDRTNNALSNLEYVTMRENTNRAYDRKDTASKHRGVWKRGDRWRASIAKNGKRYNLGSFECEGEAAKAYLDKLKELTK